MSNARQVIFSINADDLLNPSIEPKYPVGAIYEVDDVAATFPINMSTKFIYLRQKGTGFTAAAQYEPMVVTDTALPFEEAVARVPQNFDPNPPLDPFSFICSPQVAVPVNSYAFYLLEGKGKILGKDVIAINNYIKITASGSNAVVSGFTTFDNNSLGLALSPLNTPGEETFPMDTILFNRAVFIDQ